MCHQRLLLLCNVQEHTLNMIKVAIIRNRQRNRNAILILWSTGLVDDCCITHDGVGDGNLNITTRHNACTANSDMDNFATLTGIQNDIVSHFIRHVRQDKNPGKKISKRILGGKTHSNPHNARTGKPCRHIDAQQCKCEINRKSDNDDDKEILKKRNRRWCYH